MNYDRSGNTNWNTMASLVYNIFFFFGVVLAIMN